MAYQILLVDDDVSFRNEFREYFDDVKVIEASSGKEAQCILKKPNDIDLVILDEMLNNERGTEILPYLRQSAPDLDIILLTGYSSKDVIVDALRVHAADFLEKPLDQKKYQAIRSRFTAVPREKDGSFSKGLEGKIEWVKHYLRKNYDKKVSLDDVAGSVCWSTKYLSRIFKEHIGLSFSEYKLGIKVDKAKEWLQDHGRTVEQISLKLGYENPDSFIKIFKKFAKCTPSEYRKKFLFQQRAGIENTPTALMNMEEIGFHSGDAIIETDSNGKILLWTLAAEKKYGWSAKEAVGKSILDFSPIDRRKEKREILQKLRRGELVKSFEGQRLTKSGHVLDVGIALTPAWNNNGKLIKVVNVEQDITRQKKEAAASLSSKENPRKLADEKPLEQEWKKADLERFRYLSDLGRLSAMIAHELRNPIGVIGTAVWNIRRKNNNPDLEKNIRSIEKKVDASVSIINSLLEYSQIKMPRFRHVKLVEILNDSIDAVEKRFRHRQTPVHADLAGIDTAILYADPVQLKQVFKNIIVNGYQALNGIRKARIDIWGEIDSAQVSVYIRDNGPGIKKENLDNVFDLFYSERSGGTGLGLAIAKQLIEFHGGTISIKSEKGHGALVSVSFPIESS